MLIWIKEIVTEGTRRREQKNEWQSKFEFYSRYTYMNYLNMNSLLEKASKIISLNCKKTRK